MNYLWIIPAFMIVICLTSFLLTEPLNDNAVVKFKPKGFFSISF